MENLNLIIKQGVHALWQCLTGIHKKKHRPAIQLFLDDNIRKTCSDIQVKDLNKDDGLKILIKKLEISLYKNKNQAIFLTNGKFESFKNPAVMSIIDFI